MSTSGAIGEALFEQAGYATDPLHIGADHDIFEPRESNLSVPIHYETLGEADISSLQGLGFGTKHEFELPKATSGYHGATLRITIAPVNQNGNPAGTAALTEVFGYDVIDYVQVSYGSKKIGRFRGIDLYHAYRHKPLSQQQAIAPLIGDFSFSNNPHADRTNAAAAEQIFYVELNDYLFFGNDEANFINPRHLADKIRVEVKLRPHDAIVLYDVNVYGRTAGFPALPANRAIVTMTDLQLIPKVVHRDPALQLKDRKIVVDSEALGLRHWVLLPESGADKLIRTTDANPVQIPYRSFKQSVTAASFCIVPSTEYTSDGRRRQFFFLTPKKWGFLNGTKKIKGRLHEPSFYHGIIMRDHFPDVPAQNGFFSEFYSLSPLSHRDTVGVLNMAAFGDKKWHIELNRDPGEIALTDDVYIITLNLARTAVVHVGTELKMLLDV